MSEEYEPNHGDLVFLTYIKDGESHTARAIRYRQKYLGIEASTQKTNDPSVNMVYIDSFTVEKVEPLESQPHGPTDLEKKVRLAIKLTRLSVTIEIPLLKK